MRRVTLSIDDEIFAGLNNDAASNGCTLNVQIVSILEELYRDTPFDYSAALKRLVKDAGDMPLNHEFVLNELPSYEKISVVEAKNSKIRPSVVRARLGRMFNAMIREGRIKGIERCSYRGKLRFSDKAALYKKVA